MHLFGYIIRIYHDTQSHERQIHERIAVKYDDKITIHNKVYNAEED